MIGSIKSFLNILKDYLNNFLKIKKVRYMIKKRKERYCVTVPCNI